MSTERTEEDLYMEALEADRLAREGASNTPAVEQQPEQGQPREATQAPADEDPYAWVKELPQQHQDRITASLKAQQEALDRATKERTDYHDRWRAQTGQLAPIQRQNEELRRRLAAAEEAAKKRVDPAAEERAKRMREAMPQEAELLDAHLGPLRGELEETKKLREAFTALQQKVEQRDYRDSQLREIAKYRPDYEQIQDTMIQWINALDPVQQEIATNLARSPHARDAITLICMYERDEQFAQHIMSQQAQQPSATQRKPAPYPNPRNRQSMQNAPNASSSEEDEYMNAVMAAGLVDQLKAQGFRT